MSTNDVSAAKRGLDKNFVEYVETNPIDIYVDYNSELTTEQVNMILAGNADQARDDVEEKANDYGYSDGELDYYWNEMAESFDVDRDVVDKWLETEDSEYPAYQLDDHGWRQLLRNTKVYITATLWDCEWNFDNWAYGGPVNYQDVKDSLRVLGVNPIDFKNKRESNLSFKFKGWFPDMPRRVPKIAIEDLVDNTIAFFDGVLNFCLGDLENVAEVLSKKPKSITFKSGTNVVMYDFGNGAGITEVELTGDVTVPFKDIDFRNDAASTYGIQECYWFTDSFWKAGVICGNE